MLTNQKYKSTKSTKVRNPSFVFSFPFSLEDSGQGYQINKNKYTICVTFIFIDVWWTDWQSNYIKGKFCVYICVYVRYRTYLNAVGMGSKLLGVLRRTLRWSSTVQMFKKLILKNWVF
jgi:hypothetical protein